MKRLLCVLAVSFLLVPPVFGQDVMYDQLMWSNGGNLRNSQLWYDPVHGNDSDLDAIAWEDFILTQDASITHVTWYGDPAPPSGFTIQFFLQDPNTPSLQPDIFSGPFSERDYPTVVQKPIGGGLYQIDLDLVTAEDLLAETQYFIAVIGRTEFPYSVWRWAQGVGPGTGTFYWQRGDGGRYSRLGEDRAVTVSGFAHVPTLTVSPDPLVGGQNGTFEVHYMTPSGKTYLAYSLQGRGSTFVNQLNVTLDLVQPKMAGNPKTADGTGSVTWVLPIPGSAVGRSVWFQAAQFEVKSNVVATSIGN
ncbi:MAG: hypothetical protein D8M59_11455 [Planctomycetes bacterium]|nr:hypothetical protein [Planctomycetota bacterium]NOG55377.1 hypothetical protein [Planctomycetota bacterium]